MDAIAFGHGRFAPLDASREEAPAQSPWQRLVARVVGVLRVGPDGAGGAGAVNARRNLLYGYTAAEILVGIGLIAWTTANVPLSRGIDPGFGGTALEGPGGGLLLWAMFGLLGSVRAVPSRGGETHFTFHVPFVGAAMVLGGPTAGAWVALLSTIERRELETQPWYGILANHAALVIAAISGGITVLLLDGGLLALTGDPGLSRFAAIVAGAIVLETVATVLAAITIMLRDEVTRSGFAGILIGEFGRDTALEVALVWVLVVAFATVGWWAPLVLGALVIAFRSSPAPESPDPLTGLVRQAEFERQLRRKIGWIRRGLLRGGTLMYLDLDRFKGINDQYGHAVGNEVLVVVAERLRRVCPRRDDLVSRLMGDEFGVFLAGLEDRAVAVRKAELLLEALCGPIATSVGPMHVTASIGVVMVEAWGGAPSTATLLRRGDRAMYTAKRRAGPCGSFHVYSPDDRGPFDGDWPESQR